MLTSIRPQSRPLFHIWVTLVCGTMPTTCNLGCQDRLTRKNKLSPPAEDDTEASKADLHESNYQRGPPIFISAAVESNGNGSFQSEENRS